MLLNPISNDRETAIRLLRDLQLSIKRGEKLITFGEFRIGEWRKSGFDVKRYPFFDLNEEEYYLDLHTRAVERLKARFNIVLYSLIYE